MTPVEATFIMGAVASAIAIWGIFTQRAIARRRATLDHIAKTESDADLIAARRRFIALAKEVASLAPWAAEDKEQTEECQSIKLVLNDFELISIGIQRGIIDFELYKRWHKSGTIKYWKHAAPFITSLRARLSNDMIYHEFEEMFKWFVDSKSPSRARRWTAGWF